MTKAPATLEAARAAKATALRRLGDVEGCNGIGLSRRGEGYVLKVNFESEPPIEIPPRIDDVDVVVEIVGKIRKLVPSTDVPEFHVEPHPDGWAVRLASASRVESVHRTQREAIAVARTRARTQHGTLVIHARDGSVRDRDSYGPSTE